MITIEIRIEEKDGEMEIEIKGSSEKDTLAEAAAARRLQPIIIQAAQDLKGVGGTETRRE